LSNLAPKPAKVGVSAAQPGLQEATERPVRVMLITGFLGSGKSTLINQMIRSSQERWAIIENELGAVGVDSLIVEQKNEFFIELTDGCVCCRLRGDLIEALRQLHEQRHSFDRILIETTGAADPEPILATFSSEPFIRENFEFEGVVTAVDALHFQENRSRPEWTSQIVYGDLLVLTKADRVPEERLSGWEHILSGLNPIAPVCRSILGQSTPMDAAIRARQVREVRNRWRSLDGLANSNPMAAHGDLKSVLIESVLPLERLLVMSYLMIFASTWHKELYRMKGIVFFTNEPKPWLLQVVHGEISWSVLENYDEQSPRQSKVVMIVEFDRLADFFRNGLDLCQTKVGTSGGIAGESADEVSAASIGFAPRSEVLGQEVPTL
jgi:G3E family GTPase